MDVEVQHHNKTQTCLECGNKTNGKGGYLRCQKHYSLYKRKLIKEELIKKLGGKCLKCNGVFPQAAFDFHHVSNKEFTISNQILNKSKTEIFKEAEKCILLCANCHRIHHAEQF